jgi:tetratricopeptide (TPR) repeat protein
MFNKHNNYWAEKEADFARTANQVWAEEKQSSAACQYVAEYLYWGLDHYGRAIEILLDAHRREVLDEGGQSRLVEFLRLQNRFAETIPVLEPLVERRKGNLQYRVWLMNAYFKTGKPEQLAKLLKETHDYFHRDGRWNEQAMAMLGRSCLENEIYRPAVDYLAEAIALRQRTAPRRGIGDGTLSGYYGDQARAFAGLKKTPEAVDAAAAAVVTWGRDINNRNNALEALRAVLRAAPDLDAYVVRLDKHVAEVHEENPILRQAIGQVYCEKKRFGKAVEQLLIAAEVQPNDAETYKALLECYDRLNDQQGAVEQILAWRELAPRDIKLYEDLGKRLEKLGQAAEVERAYTSIVEALPAESESHQLLAEIRQRQDRWADAADQWRQVARIRSLEPTGLLGLADALIHQRRFVEAAEVLTQLKQKSWPARFQNWPTNLSGKISELERMLDQARKAK